jgi:hypothetical protein
LPRIEGLVGGGHVSNAEHLARETVDMTDDSDNLLARGRARLALATAVAAMGQRLLAAREAEKGAELLEAKGAIVFAQRGRMLTAALRGEGSPIPGLPSEVPSS